MSAVLAVTMIAPAITHRFTYESEARCVSELARLRRCIRRGLIERFNLLGDRCEVIAEFRLRNVEHCALEAVTPVRDGRSLASGDGMCAV